MALGVRLKIVDTEFHTTFRDAYALLPVRIGRSALNDVRLSKRQVSQFHAVLELAGDKLMLRDLGSRNGTILRSGRAPAHELVELGASGSEFRISTFKFEALLTEVDPTQVDRQQVRKGLLDSEAPPPRDQAARATRFEVSVDLPDSGKAGPKSPALAPAGSSPPPGAEDLLPLCEEVRSASARLMQTAVRRTMGLPSDQARAVVEWLRGSVPGIERDRDFQKMQRVVGFSEQDPERQRLREYVAAQGLRELAHGYLPDRPEFSSEDDVLRFLSRVRDVLDVFFVSFVPLRDGFETFRTEFDVQRPADRGAARNDAIQAVRTVATSAALAQRLLDWREELPGARKAVEGVFADLMIHEMALLNGLVRGVQSMVQEISPAVIEEALEQRKKAGGLFSGLFRYRELWRMYQQRHGDLEDGEKRIFKLVFGPAFSRAYARFVDDGADADATARTGPPER